jgi:hypothetical protein
LEAIDLRQPTFCGPATVLKVAEHILLIHFDGWKRDYNKSLQLIDAQSTDIYPCGWTELVGHSFQSCPELPMLEDCPAVSSCGNGEAERSPHPESMGSEENKKKGGLKIRISANGIGGGLCVV